VFRDREDAGRKLAAALVAYRGDPDAVVLGIPRGGVVVAASVASELGLPLDVAVAAKVASPGNPEYAVGAVAADGVVSANAAAGLTLEQVAQMSGPARSKIAHESAWFREDRPPLVLTGRTAILVDDGLATGLTAMAAADWLHREGAARVVVAVPVAPPDTVALMRMHAEELVVLEQPEWFSAVGQFYERFGQTEDAEVSELLGG